ncbi:lipid storage droplets surface-binding protein 1-like isoform X2 [Anthonomus grandis grandis]|uniref:lipid storage droplets surface-binding protein 1-like isoform X2 n=1 Tax=Anthonomus grandis grandis TaxID=2921223 RepID=UPI00216553AB|nr:lipid storage droplets surface-binding protein 1-like isoform X2 [Anthonomus grandis grandis]
MSTSADNTNQATSVAVAPATCMESVNRVAKLPVVESTLQTAHNLYEKVKEYNNVTHWTLQTAEDTAFKAVDIAKPYATPVIKNLEGPIKKVDGVLCSGLDYVESKVPAVKLPPKEIYENTKEYVTPAMETAKSYVEPAVKTAKDVLEPAFEKTRSVVEPIVEPIVENVRHKVDEYLHRNQEASTAAEAEQTEEASPKQETSPDTSVGSLNSSTGPDTSS